MIRTPIRPTEEQSARLRRRARAEGRSVSDLVRESAPHSVDEDPGRAAPKMTRRAEAAPGKFRSGAPDLAEEHDRHLAESFEP